MKKLLFLGACLVALASQPVMAQTGGPEVVIVQVYSRGGATYWMSVTRGSGKTEETEIKDANNPRNYKEATAYQGMFDKLVQEGYSLKSTFGFDSNLRVTFVFEKRH